MKFPTPLIAGFNPDPSIVRVGEDYYLTTSTFEYRPGLPIYHSRNLVDWELVNHVVTRPGQLQDKGVITLGGAWAPTIRHHEGRFYVAVTDAAGRGTVVFTAKNITDEFCDGVEIDIDGIDPDLAWDENGTCFMSFSGLILKGSDFGTHKGIQQVRVDLDTGKTLEKVRDIWSGTGLMFPEAPHLYFFDGWWYLVIAEGGTERGHAVSIARSKAPDGPFEPCPTNPILTARSTDRPIQNVGHADLVQTSDGSWVMVMLGMRPRGATRAFSSLGRESFATNFKWTEGWPVVEPVELDATTDAPSYQIDFVTNSAPFEANSELVSVRAFPQSISKVTASGLKLIGAGKSLDDQSPTFIGRRQRRFDSLCRVKMSIDSPSTRAGLAVRFDENSHYDIEYSNGQLIARSTLSRLKHEVVADAFEIDTSQLELYIEMGPSGPSFVDLASSDVVHLGYIDRAGARREVAAFDGRYLSAEVTTSFTGRVIGFYAVEGEITVKEFSESPALGSKSFKESEITQLIQTAVPKQGEPT